MMVFKNILLKTYLPALISVSLIIISCSNQTVYSKYKKIHNYIWNYNNSIEFEFEIKDTSINYNVFFNLRNAGVFPYSNIWILINGYSPEGKEFLAQRYEFLLADESGKWTGKGLGDIIDNHFLIMENVKFTAKGINKLEIKHDMRIDNLPGVMDLGISVRKVKK